MAFAAEDEQSEYLVRKIWNQSVPGLVVTMLMALLRFRKRTG